MTSDQRVTAAFIIIGNEILSGRTQDANLSFLAGRLGEIGIQMVEARVIPDVEQTIIDTVQTLSAQVDYVFTSGGIGPTHDDITADAVAKAFGTETFEDPEAVALLEAHYAAGEFNAARRKMARVPRGSTLLANPVSTAPGFRIGNVHVLAGVPKIMQAMVDMLLPGLTGGAVVESRTITVLIGESLIAPEMAAVENAHPASMSAPTPTSSRVHRGRRSSCAGPTLKSSSARSPMSPRGWKPAISKSGPAITSKPRRAFPPRQQQESRRAALSPAR